MPSFEVPAESILSESVQILREALHSDDFWPAIHAAEGLTELGDGDEVRECLQPRLLQETDLRRRCGLARELARAGDSSQVAVLSAVLAHVDPFGHVHACESLLKIREVGEVSLLRAAMTQTAAPLKSLMAAGALARQGDVDALELLRSEMSREDSEFIGIVGWILGILGNEEDLSLLRQGLKYARTPARRAPLEHALAMLGDSSGRQALLKNLDHPEVTIRAEAAVLAGQAALPQARRQLKELHQDEQRDVRVRAAHGFLLLHRDSNNGYA